jgi:hypothetical protein
VEKFNREIVSTARPVVAASALAVNRRRCRATLSLLGLNINSTRYFRTIFGSNWSMASSLSNENRLSKSSTELKRKMRST